ncbi:MAG: TrkH family potassium uptake protein [Dehalococcoidia bacterium]|nr:MAG: TrkH family potassium uptake protein [Dehalococcoidia bacterium]
MRLRVILHYIGLVNIFLGLFMLLPLGFCLFHREPDSLSFGISIALSLISGLLFWRLKPLKVANLGLREVMVIVILSWISASAISAIIYSTSGALPNYLDAFFESVAGFTTTGATVFTSLETQLHGILLWRSLTQWLGGMGIIMFFVVLFPMVGMGAAELVKAETPGQETGRITARIKDTFKILLTVYIGLTVCEFLLLHLTGMHFFDALTISLSTTATGGFAPTDASIGAYDSVWIEGIIIFFMIAAGVNFSLYYLAIWKRHPKSLFNNSEFKLYIAILVIATLIINIDLIINLGLPLGEAIRESSFQSVSLVTTTGFATADFNTWPTFSRAVVLILMVVGASAGSTGGALKIVRFLILSKFAYRKLLRHINPSRIVHFRIGGNIIPEDVIGKAIGFTILYFGIILIGLLIMSALGLDFDTAISSVTSCIGNVGPGLGLVGPEENYFLIPVVGKIVLIVCMLAGRVEIFTLFALFTPSFWKWR